MTTVILKLLIIVQDLFKLAVTITDDPEIQAEFAKLLLDIGSLIGKVRTLRAQINTALGEQDD